MEYYRDRVGNPIQLTFDANEFLPPGHVLIIPLYKGKLVCTKHKTRGIELPGGKIEPGETPLAAAVRELYEETGASLTSISLIGQYRISFPDTEMIKSIYLAEVEELHPISYDTDSLGAVVFDSIPINIEEDTRFSIYMRDQVYPRVLDFLGLK